MLYSSRHANGQAGQCAAQILKEKIRLNLRIQTEQDLEELLSLPDEKTSTAMAALEGDILILGAGGKMGPSLCRLARRAADQAGVKKKVIAVARFTNRALPLELSALGIETISADLLDPGALDNLPDIPNII